VKSSRKMWTDREVEVLTKLWTEKVSDEDIIIVFPTRSWGAIKMKARYLNLGNRPRDSVDEDYLKQLLTVVEG